MDAPYGAAMGLLADFLVPPACIGCRQAGGVWCGNCLLALSELALPPEPEELADGVRAVGAYAYEGLARDVLLGVKTSGRHDVTAHLGALLHARLKPPPPSGTLAWTWVPTSARSMRERLMRDVPDQTSLSARERRTSPRGAYRAIGRVPPAVVVFDDIRTTGGTALAIAEALHTAGARRILVLTFAVSGRDARARLRAGDESG